MTKRKAMTVRYPWVVKLPKGASSPTNSVYKQFDIVEQAKVLNTIQPAIYTIRSAGPFTIKAKVNGKVKTYKAKLT